MSGFTLRVFHPSIDPRQITEELGLPPQTSWRAGEGRTETFWQTRLAGSETGSGDVNAALRDIAARFEHYRFFVAEMRADGGRVEVAVAGEGSEIDEEMVAAFRALNIVLSVTAS